jgi:hypothetical protein
MKIEQIMTMIPHYEIVTFSDVKEFSKEYVAAHHKKNDIYILSLEETLKFIVENEIPVDEVPKELVTCDMIYIRGVIDTHKGILINIEANLPLHFKSGAPSEKTHKFDNIGTTIKYEDGGVRTPYSIKRNPLIRSFVKLDVLRNAMNYFDSKKNESNQKDLPAYPVHTPNYRPNRYLINKNMEYGTSRPMVFNPRGTYFGFRFENFEKLRELSVITRTMIPTDGLETVATILKS